MINVSKYSVRLVKESGGRYEIDEKISSPSEAANLFKLVFNLNDLCEENMVMFTLDTKYKINGAFTVSVGSIDSSIVHPREIFKRALVNNATAIVLGHNHPSGTATPSLEDIKATKRLIDAGKIIGIEVLDHIIIGQGDYDDCEYCSIKEIKELIFTE